MTEKSRDAGSVIPFPVRSVTPLDGPRAGVNSGGRPVTVRRLGVEFATTVFGEHWYHDAAIEQDRKPRLKQ